MYVQFPLSLRNVDNLLFERGIDNKAALAFIKQPLKRY